MGRVERRAVYLEARGYNFRVPVIQDNELTNSPLLATAEVPLRCLRPARISHVLLNTGARGYYIRRGLDPVGFRLEFRKFAQPRLIPVHRGQGSLFYRIRE